jgi:hypothetical protein
MCFALNDNVSFCWVGGRRIFLDLAQDRYFALGASSEAAFDHLTAGKELSQSDERSIDELVRRGILRRDSVLVRPEISERAASPSGSVRDMPGYAPRPHGISSVMMDLAAAALSLRMRGLRHAVGDVQRRKAVISGDPPGADQRSIQTIAAAFHWSGIITPSRDKCLPRSLALMRHALRQGHRPDLVFAVMVRPFKAHCWVQQDGLVVNDDFDNVRAFTPILVV